MILRLFRAVIPALHPSTLQVYADQTNRKRSIESMFLCQSIRQYSAYGKRPAVTCFSAQLNRCFCANLSVSTVHLESVQVVTCFSGRTRDEWFERLHSEGCHHCMMDLTWALVRMPPLKLFVVDIFPSEKQTVPGWSGFKAVVHSCVPVLTNIGTVP